MAFLSISANLIYEDIKKLQRITDSLCEAFSEVVMPRDGYFDYPVWLTEATLPPMEDGEAYRDEIMLILSQIDHLWEQAETVGKIQFRPNSLILNYELIQITLEPVGEEDIRKFADFSECIQMWDDWIPCRPMITIAKLFPGKRFPTDGEEALVKLFRSSPLELTVDMGTITL